MVVAAAALAFALLSLIVTIAAAMTTAPYVPTPLRSVRRALAAADLRPGELLVDLGCGNGRVLVIAAREFKARSIGYELSPHRALIAWLNVALRGLRKSAEVRSADLFTADVSRADVVFIWLTPRAAALEEKLLSELRSGARVAVFSTPLFSGWEPERVLRDEGERPIYLYRVPGMRH
jgi:trans-aconitate methyltransferase